MVAAAVVGAAVVGGAASYAGSRQISKATKEAAQIGNDQFEVNRQDAVPWRDAGIEALGQITDGIKPGGEFNRSFTLADFTKDPGYDFRLGEGVRGVENSAAARGGVLSGGALKELTRYNQGFASNEFGNAYNRWNNDISNRFNRLSGVAGTGQQATRDVAQMGTDNARNAGDMLTSGASARASGYAGVANSVNSATSTLANWYQGQQVIAALGKKGP